MDSLRVVFVAAVAIVVAASCRSGARGSGGATTTSTSIQQSTSSSSSLSTTTAAPSPELELTGYRIAQFTCPSSMNPGAQVHLLPSSVTAILLCPPEIPHQQQKPTMLGPANPAFRSLLTALTAPDDPPSTEACPALVALPSPILVRTVSEPLVVKVPVDGCGFPQQAVQEAIGRARVAGG